MIKVLITGGTGLIGKQLVKMLLIKGYEVAVLSRKPKEKNEFEWNISEGFIDKKAFENTTHIIHLAGAGIANKRWTKKRKQELIDSRVETTNLLLEKVKEYKTPLQKFISASGIGFYGAITSNKIFTEKDAPHNDFIAKICVEWEKAALKFEQINVHVTILRTGIVLSKSGGALQKINTPFFLAFLGKGNQYMPWIHINDVCGLYKKAIEDNNFKGIFNAIAPEHQTNKSFTKLLGKTINKTVFPIGVPSFILKIILGEMATILLRGSRVSAQKTTKEYNFTYTSLKEAFAQINTQ